MTTGRAALACIDSDLEEAFATLLFLGFEQATAAVPDQSSDAGGRGSGAGGVLALGDPLRVETTTTTTTPIFLGLLCLCLCACVHVGVGGFVGGEEVFDEEAVSGAALFEHAAKGVAGDEAHHLDPRG